jgi:hypothetical protein
MSYGHIFRLKKQNSINVRNNNLIYKSSIKKTFKAWFLLPRLPPSNIIYCLLTHTSVNKQGKELIQKCSDENICISLHNDKEFQ